MMKKLLTLVLSLCALGLATAAKADPIGGPGSNCGSCQGATYTLFSDFIDLDPGAGTTWAVHLLIDTSTYTGTGVAISTVAVKIDSSINSATLVLFPANSGDWATLANVGLNANGCSGGGSGFACSHTGTDPAEVGGSLEWVWEISFNAPAIDPASIKVRYVDGNGDKVGDLVSEKIHLQCPPGSTNCTPPPFLVSEPSSVALLGMAFLIVGMVANRRRRNG